MCLVVMAGLSFFSLIAVSDISVKLTTAYINQLGNEYGEEAKRRLIAWQNLIKESADLPEKEKLA